MRAFVAALALLGVASAQILDVTPPVSLINGGWANPHRIMNSAVS